MIRTVYWNCRRARSRRSVRVFVIRKYRQGGGKEVVIVETLDGAGQSYGD